MNIINNMIYKFLIDVLNDDHGIPTNALDNLADLANYLNDNKINSLLNCIEVCSDRAFINEDDNPLK